MTKRFDICTPREGSNGKTYWTRIGTAFEGDKGIQLVFDALPIADSKGRVVANLFEPREKNDGQRQQSRQPQPAGYAEEPPF
jgi:hypothetical protein